MATSIVKFHVFSGAQSNESPCYMLQIDDFHFLLDCGWDAAFSEQYVASVAQHARLIDAILISHANLRHLGALPYLMRHCALDCPIYMTAPVSKMGQMCLYDAVLCRYSAGLHTPFSLDDVDAAFDRVIEIKYQQTRSAARGALRHPGGDSSVANSFGATSIQITALNAGHSLGGTIWRIGHQPPVQTHAAAAHKQDDAMHIFYAVDFNHKKEWHLRGAAFDQLFQAQSQPHLLITNTSQMSTLLPSIGPGLANVTQLNPLSSFAATAELGGAELETDKTMIATASEKEKEKHSRRRRHREDRLKDVIHATLSGRGGNVLLVADTAGRVLELVHLLEQWWSQRDPPPSSSSSSSRRRGSGGGGGNGPMMMQYGLALLSNVALNVIEFARSFIEWMSAEVVEQFEARRANPFQLRHMRVCHSLAELEATVPQPCLVLASQPHLEYGSARSLLAHWCRDARNTVLFTSGLTVCDELRHLVATNQTQQQQLAAVAPLCEQSTLIGQMLAIAVEREKHAEQQEQQPIKIWLELSERVAVSPNESSWPIKSEAHQQIHTKEEAVDSEKLSQSQEAERPPRDDKTMGGDDDETDAAAVRKRRRKRRKSESKSGGANVAVRAAGWHANITTRYDMHQSTEASHQRHLQEHTNRCGPAHAWFRQTQLLFPEAASIDPEFPTGEATGEGGVSGGARLPFGINCFTDSNLLRHTSPAMASPPTLKSPPSPQSHTQPHHALLAAKREPTSSESTAVRVGAALIGQSPQQQQPAITAVEERQLAALCDPAHTPTRLLRHRFQLAVRCRVAHVDFEGRSDGAATRQLLEKMRPQEVILIGGAAQCTNALAEHCRRVIALDPARIHTPVRGQLVDCTKAGHIFQARMQDALVSSLAMRRVRDYEIAWLDADMLRHHLDQQRQQQLDMPVLVLPGQRFEEQQEEETGEEAAGDESDQRDTRDALERVEQVVSAAAHRWHKPVLVNEPKLSDVKQLLLKHKLEAEFQSGQLVVNQSVVIRRAESGKFCLEGPISKVYFQVRTLLYSQFAII